MQHETPLFLAYKVYLKGQSQLWDRANPDTSLLTMKYVHPNRPEIKVYLEIHFHFRSVLLDFNLSWKTCFGVSFCSSYNNIFITSGKEQYLSRLCYMQISFEMVSNAHVRQLTVSL